MREKIKTNRGKKIAGILILAIILLLLLTQCRDSGGTTIVEKIPTIFDLTEDSGATVGVIESDPAIVEKLNEQVAESMMNISMNSNPTFVEGVGNVLISNSDTNRNPQVVEIYYGEDLIYQSGVIPVGSKLEQAELSADLQSGVYDCTAYFNSIDSETGELLGRVGINIKVTVM